MQIVLKMHVAILHMILENILDLLNCYMKAKLLSDIIAKTLTQALNKEELMTIHLIQNWDKILSNLHQVSRPERLLLKQGLLIVRVTEGHVMMMQYQQEHIKAAVNMFLGREYVQIVHVKGELETK